MFWECSFVLLGRNSQETRLTCFDVRWLFFIVIFLLRINLPVLTGWPCSIATCFICRIWSLPLQRPASVWSVCTGLLNTCTQSALSSSFWIIPHILLSSNEHWSKRVCVFAATKVISSQSTKLKLWCDCQGSNPSLFSFPVSLFCFDVFLSPAVGARRETHHSHTCGWAWWCLQRWSPVSALWCH